VKLIKIRFQCCSVKPDVISITARAAGGYTTVRQRALQGFNP